VVLLAEKQSREGGREGEREGETERLKDLPSSNSRDKLRGDLGVVGRALVHIIPQPARARGGRAVELEGGREGGREEKREGE